MPDKTLISAPRWWIWMPPVVFLLLMALVHFSEGNQTLFFQINVIAQFTGDALWANLTILGDTLVAAVLILPLFRRRPDIVWALVLAAIFATTLTHSLKPLFDVPRPAAVLAPDSFRVIGPTYYYNAFPSGHAVTISTLAGVLVLTSLRVWSRIVYLVFSLLVSVSRITVGVHWPLDVMAGIVIGWISAWAGLTCAQLWPWGYHPIARIVWGTILLVAATVLLVIHHTAYDQALLLQRTIALIGLVWGGVEFRLLLTDVRPRRRKYS